MTEFDPDYLKPVNSEKRFSKFDLWERKLLDFTLRNSLLNMSLRRRAVQIISADIDVIESYLLAGRDFIVAHRPNLNISANPEMRLLLPDMTKALHKYISDDIKRGYLHTFLPEDDNKKTLRHIQRNARNAIEETGANSLFLAIGALKWYETPQTKSPRFAPILLLPVEMVYKKNGFHIRTRDEDIMLNVTLMEFMRQNYDIYVDEGLEPLPRDTYGIDVKRVFSILRNAIKGEKKWEVEEQCVLGIFSFSKFLMWNDIHSHRRELKKSEIIDSLVAGHLTFPAEPIEIDLAEIDRNVSPGENAIPLDVDSSQLSAVMAAAQGQSYILYGPPGSGKSQTITNIIANALYHGKRVLFVAEKMAALSVVQSRLTQIGLEPFCLELHSNKSTKRHVLKQLEMSLMVKREKAPEDYLEVADKLFESRKKLIAYLDALHANDPSDSLSPYDCITLYEGIEAEPLQQFKYDKRIDAFFLKEGSSGVELILGERLEAMLRLVKDPLEHPMRGLKVSKEMVADPDALHSSLNEDSAILEEAIEEYEMLDSTVALREKILLRNAFSIFDEDPENLRKEWETARARWFLPRYFATHKFLERLKRYNQSVSKEDVPELLENLRVYRRNHGIIKSLHEVLQKYYPEKYREDRMPPYQTVMNAGLDLKRWAENLDLISEWYLWQQYCTELTDKGMGCVAELLNTSLQSVDAVKHPYLKALYKYKAQDKIRKSDVLAVFAGIVFDVTIKVYKNLADQLQELTRKELYARLASRVPMRTSSKDTASESGFLNRNISNGGRGVSLRDLFEKLPRLLPRMCPCMLMSPMSVAQYLDIKANKFDLIIFDEASQIPTSEAIGAIARGKSLIVVGDPKQMPPTSFFMANTVDAEEVAIDDMESILEDCRTLDLPYSQLSWHYRSRHESLIAFSNNEYYDGSLITFPSVDDRKSRVHFHYVEGCYDKGGNRTNDVEAEAIVDEIERRLRDENLRGKSIGVIAFSVMQQSLIEDILQDRIEKDKALQELATAMYEPIFVKNLENVQGDERDVILFSIGYGPDADGKVSMNFGPLNNSGGERRLNVAVSRARQEMHVFSSLKASDLDLRRSKALGVVGLKHFLHYAQTGSLPSTSRNVDSHISTTVAEQLADELRRRGYTVDTHVGRSQFKVDVAVSDKKNGKYILAILLDGHTYRDTPTTRDREKVQPMILQGLGWKVWRVWSVDWFNNREKELNTILSLLHHDQSDMIRHY